MKLKHFMAGTAMVILISGLVASTQIAVANDQAQTGCTITVEAGQSLQAVIDSASEGAVVCLGEGVWRENILIEKGVTIRGMGEERTVIEGQRDDAPTILVNLSSHNDQEVRLSSLTIRGARGITGHGVEVRGHSHLTLDTAVVEANTEFGIWIGECSQVTVRSCKIRRNVGGGIWIGDFAAGVIAESDVVENGGDGIIAAGSPSLFLESSSVAGNKGYGVVIDGPECTGGKGEFTGLVSGQRNLIPWPGLADANDRGSVCPDEISFLMTEAGGAWNRRTLPAATCRGPSTIRFLLQAKGVGELLPNRRSEIMSRLVQVLKARLSQLDLLDVELRPIDQDKVEVVVVGVQDLDRVKKLLTTRSILSVHKLLDEYWNPDKWADIDSTKLILPDRDGTTWYLLEAAPLLTGEAVENAFLKTFTFPSMSEYAIYLRLTPEGADAFARVLQGLKAGDRLAIVLDGVVYSAPTIASSILRVAKQGGEGIRESLFITGHFSLPEAEDLTLALRSGGLPVDVTVLEETQY